MKLIFCMMALSLSITTAQAKAPSACIRFGELKAANPAQVAKALAENKEDLEIIQRSMGRLGATPYILAGAVFLKIATSGFDDLTSDAVQEFSRGGTDVFNIGLIASAAKGVVALAFHDAILVTSTNRLKYESGSTNKAQRLFWTCYDERLKAAKAAYFGPKAK